MMLDANRGDPVGRPDLLSETDLIIAVGGILPWMTWSEALLSVSSPTQPRRFSAVLARAPAATVHIPLRSALNLTMIGK
jgi:hypothetical protein